MSGLEDATEPAVPAAQADHSNANSDMNSDPQVTPVAPDSGEEVAPIGSDTPAAESAAAAEPTPEPAVAPEPVPEPAPAAVEPEPAAVEPEPESAPAAVEPEPVATEPEVAPEPTASTPEAFAAEPAAAADAAPVSEPVPAPPVAEPAPVATEPASTTELAAPAATESAPATEPASTTELAAPAATEPAPTTDIAAPAAGAPTAESAPAGEESADGAPPPPSAAPRPRPATETGKIVEGLVTAVSADGVELTLDDGRQAVITRRNFGLNDEDPSTVVSVGDKAHGAELLREDPKGRVVLSRSWALKRQAWEKIVEAAAENKLLTGKVISASKKGLVVDVGVRGFIPSSHLELNAVTDMSPYVGESFELKILEVDPRREKLVLSRRSLLLKAQRKEMQEMLGSLKKGEVRSGTVSSLAEYGAFVDLGGVNGLVHISELSWQRVSKPSQVVSVGDQVEVKILDVKPKKKRISLSIRQITPDPLSAIEVGAVQTGKVTRLVDYGAFVAIGEFEGLVHLSELAEYRVSTPEEIVAPGDEVGVKILSVDKKRRRIELSIRRAAEYGG